MSNAAHAQRTRLHAAAQAMLDKRREVADRPTCDLHELSDGEFHRYVEMARAALDAVDALPPVPRARGPLNAFDASALALDLGACVLVVIARDADGKDHAVVWGRGQPTAVLDPAESSAALSTVAAALSALEDAATPEANP